MQAVKAISKTPARFSPTNIREIEMKHHRKYQADPLAAFRLISKLQPFTDEQMAEVALPARMAFEQIKTGIGSEGAFNELCYACNATMVRSEKIDDLCVQTCQIAQEALLRCRERYTRTGRWGFDGPALGEILPMLDLHEQIISLSNPLEMNAAFQEQAKRLQTFREAA